MRAADERNRTAARACGRARCGRLLGALLLGAAAAAAAAELEGRVVGVHDGDTLTVLLGRTPQRVRLVDIDAPELRQPFGTRARQALAELCFGQLATLEPRGIDRYQRMLARVRCGGREANSELVRSGYAWTFTRYAAPDSPLHGIERKARAARRGLWVDPAPIPPWDWRRIRRSSAPAAPDRGS